MPTTSSMEADRNDLVFCFCSYTAMEDARLIPVKELELHNEPEDCWLVIEDQVWDFSAFATSHPGGEGSRSLLHTHIEIILTSSHIQICRQGCHESISRDP